MYRFKHIIRYMGISLFLCMSCQEETLGPLSPGGETPGKVSSVTIENRPGGAMLRYQIPNNENLLYVKAVFEYPAGNFREVKSSMYVDSLLIEGIGDTEERAIQLFSVSRSEVVSEPETVYINPLTPPVQLIANTLSVSADFGGLTTMYENSLMYAVVIEVLKKVDGQWTNIESNYTNLKSGMFSVRRQEAIPSEFGLYVRDRWNNKSDTTLISLIPLHEVQLPAPNWINSLASDYNLFYLNYHYGYMFDGVISSGNYAGTLVGAGSQLPSSFTLDFGKPTSFSRFKYWMRQNDANGRYSYASPEKWELWGANVLTDNWDQWTLISEYTAVKPSGAPLGTLTAIDRETSDAGLEFNFPPGTPPYRYIRWRTTKNFGSLNAVQISELAFFGSDQ